MYDRESGDDSEDTFFFQEKIDNNFGI